MTYHLTYATSVLLALASACGLVPSTATGGSYTGAPEDDTDEGGDDGGGGEGGQGCYEYAPGEAGGKDYTPLLTKEQIEQLDLEIDWPNTPIAALDASAIHLANDDRLRLVFAGLVEVNHDEESTPFEFHDVPLQNMSADNFAIELDGEPVQPERVTCTSSPNTEITAVFAIDVTGSMTPLIEAVRDSLIDFVDAAVGLGLEGKIGMVTFQDTVGVNISFEDCTGVDGPIPERSPFFAPVDLTDDAGVASLRAFVASLHADLGTDGPENLAAAIDFISSNSIGYTADGDPNVIGEGDDDPPWTSPWPIEKMEGLVVIIPITDSTHHRPDSTSPWLRDSFRPRRFEDILTDLDGKVVATIDPAILDGETELFGTSEAADADLWPRYTGGFGRDRYILDVMGVTEGISYMDLELLLIGRGLLEIPLAPVLASTCVLEVSSTAPVANARVEITHDAGAVVYEMTPEVISY